VSGFFSPVAGAALPVAIGLLILAAAAAAVPWTGIDDGRLQRVAREYLEPLSTWCLVAVAVYALALGAAGGLELSALVLPLGLGAAAGLLRPAGAAGGRPLRPAGAAGGRPAAQPAARPPAARTADTAPAAAAPTAPSGSLWADRTEHDAARQGLWGA
jgi:hypothetical protein